MNVILSFGWFLVALQLFAFADGANCPNGGQIFAWGISENGKRDVINFTNDRRRRVMNGQVPGQPRGKNIKMTRFDDYLASQGRKVSQTCQMAHNIAKDNRWGWVGQNLYLTRSSSNAGGEDWAAVVEGWYSEYKCFKYPSSSTCTSGHYTQLIWADSEYVGCDYIFFYDPNYPQYPYTKLYTCNYGPGGNYQGQAPYERA